jgi:hypothetical protein
MIGGAMVWHNIYDNPDPEGSGVFDEIVEVFQGAESAVHIKKVADIIAAVAHR